MEEAVNPFTQERKCIIKGRSSYHSDKDYGTMLNRIMELNRDKIAFFTRM
jgi:hypothetical protein